MDSAFGVDHGYISKGVPAGLAGAKSGLVMPLGRNSRAAYAALRRGSSAGGQDLSRSISNTANKGYARQDPAARRKRSGVIAGGGGQNEYPQRINSLRANRAESRKYLNTQTRTKPGRYLP